MVDVKQMRKVVVLSIDEDGTATVENASSGGHAAPMSDVTREEMNARLDATDSRVGAALDGFRAEMAEFRADMRGDMAELRAELRDGLTAARIDFAKDQLASQRWFVSILFSVLLATIGIILTVVLRTH